MKKIILIGISLMLVGLAVVLVACRGNENNLPNLDSEIASRIKQDFIQEFDLGQAGYTVDDVTVIYFGTYNNWAVVLLQVYTGATRPGFQEVTIAGYKFTFYADLDFLAWNDGQFYDWEQAHTKEFLSQNNISNIHRLLSAM